MKYIFFSILDNKLEFVNKDDILDGLYFLKYKVPSENFIANYKKHDEFYDIFQKDKNFFKKQKINMSKLEYKIPLYDIYSANMFLIEKYDVYNRVVRNFFKFPELGLLNDLKNKKNEYEKKNVEDILKKRELKKINLMLEYMSYFDNEILYETYIKVFYKYSEFVGKELTTCKKLSFLPQLKHITPYYSRTEIINIARNSNIKISDNIDYSDMREICNDITKNEMNADMLLKHKEYMTMKKCIGMIQYYTLQGSSTINPYMRGYSNYKDKNYFLEDQIQPIWNLIINSPPFDKNYTLYRFITKDDYISNLKIGDYFVENGFMSTSRDPFYVSDKNFFGYILIKINIPKNIKGIALCLETISHFPQEQEIIFPPLSKFKLISKDNNCIYHHIDPKFISKINTKYEFNWISNGDIYFPRKKSETKLNNINFLNLEMKMKKNLDEKIEYFENYYLNSMKQFSTNIGDKKITIIGERYNSKGVYYPYYAIKTSNGFSLYSVYDNYICFFLELGIVDGVEQMHVNYYVKYSALDTEKIFGDNNLLLFYSSVARYFGIHNVFLYASYMNCDNKNNVSDENYGSMLSGSFCVDFYNYFTQGTKRYNNIKALNIDLFPLFSYYNFDYLKNISVDKILTQMDGEIYQIYEKLFLASYKIKDNKDNKDNIIEFYIWLKNHKCYLLEIFVEFIDRIIKKNPFKNATYLLDPISFLYNRKYIKSYSSKFRMISS